MNKWLLFFSAFLIFCFFRTEFAQQRKPEICTGGIVNGITTYFPQPEYPEDAKEKNISGSVSVRVSIDEEGNVTEAKACSGHLLLRSEAETAALKAKLKQTKLSGIPVKVFGVLVYNFNLNEEKIIKGGIINGRTTYLPSPDYPKEAENICAGGKVEVEILIGEDGNVISAKAISGEELLQKSAIEAAKKAKFRPIEGATPMKLRGIVVYNFDSKVKCITNGIVNKIAVINFPKPNATHIIHPKHFQIKKEEIVAVQIVVDFDGNVIYADAIAGHPALRNIGESSARHTKFRINGTFPQVKVKALLAYKFKPDGTVETDIEKDDKDVIGTPINLVKPPPVSCNCKFGENPSVLVEAKIDEKGNVIEAKAVSGHPILKSASEKAALESKFLPTNIKAKIIIKYNFDSTGKWYAKFSDIEIKKVEIEKPVIIGHPPPNTKPIFMPQPDYPAAAKAVGAEGEVTVEILIDENGDVKEAKAVSGHPLLRSAAEKAAKLAKFKPITLSGTPVKVRGVLVCNFN